MTMHNSTEVFGAVAVLVLDDGVALQRRSDDFAIVAARGRLGLFGGQVEADESPVDGLRRELNEELGIDRAEIHAALGSIKGDYGGRRSVTHGWLVRCFARSTALTCHEGALVVVPRLEDVPRDLVFGHYAFVERAMYERRLP